LFGYGRNSGLPNLPREGQAGLLEQADGGVLFLDEIGELPRQAQLLLLLPLEGRAFGPAVGSGPPRTVNVKFVCATNRDLPREVEGGRFPRDLYERLAGQVIRLPSLRERPGDVAILAERLLSEATPEAGSALLLDAAALEALVTFSWPGNVRQLRNVIRRAAQRARLNGHEAVQRGDLGDEFQRREPSSPPTLDLAAVPAAAVHTRLAVTKQEEMRWFVQRGFSEREARELVVLRDSGFQVGEAEVRLGYSGEARTLTRRLRGMTFKSLSFCDADVERAAALLLGGDPTLQAKVALRVQKVVHSVTPRLGESDGALVDNLPGEYRRYAVEVFAMLRPRRS